MQANSLNADKMWKTIYCKEIFKITFYYIVFNSLKVEKNKQAVLINSGLKWWL